jgi:hypothetical protein
VKQSIEISRMLGELLPKKEEPATDEVEEQDEE